MPPLRFSIPAQPNKKNQASLFSRRVAWQGAGRRVHTGSWNARSRHQSPMRAAATAEHPICPSIPLPLRSVSPGSRKPISAFPRSYRPLRRPSLAHTSQALQPKGQRCDLLPLATVARRSGAIRTGFSECAASRKDPGPRGACVPNPHPVYPQPGGARVPILCEPAQSSPAVFQPAVGPTQPHYPGPGAPGDTATE